MQLCAFTNGQVKEIIFDPAVLFYKFYLIFHVILHGSLLKTVLWRNVYLVVMVRTFLYNTKIHSACSIIIFTWNKQSTYP